jgi:hypothetical protein
MARTGSRGGGSKSAQPGAAKSNGGANLGFETKLWAAADALRNNMDAAEYKHVVLGLIFLKYISDAFEAKHAELAAQKAQGADPEDPDEYRANRTRRLRPRQWLDVVEPIQRKRDKEGHHRSRPRRLHGRAAGAVVLFDADTGVLMVPSANQEERPFPRPSRRDAVHRRTQDGTLVDRVTPQYEKDRGKYRKPIDLYQTKIAKAVDLFSSIKSTAQAEDVLTVLFASRELKQAKRTSDDAEQDLQDYTLDWKSPGAATRRSKRSPTRFATS